MDKNTDIKKLILVLNEAIALQRRGEAAAAEDRYQKILSFEGQFKGLAAKTNGHKGVTVVNTMFSQVYNNLGHLREKENNLNQAMTNFCTALDYAPGSVEAHTSLARVFFKKHNLEKALETAQKAVSLQPDFLPGVVQLCRAAFVLDVPEVALKALLKLKGSGDKSVPLNTEYGRILEKMGKRVEAREKYKIALSLAPDNIYALWNSGNVNFHLAKYGEALEHYQRILEIRPGYSDAYRNIGYVYQRTGLFRKAEQAYQKALELNPSDAEAFTNFASLKEQQQDYQGALKLVKDVLKTPKIIQSLKLFALQIMAICQRNLGDPEESIKTAHEMLELSSKPEDLHRAYFELAQSHDVLGQEQEAFTSAQKANQEFLATAGNFRDDEKSLFVLVQNLLDYDFAVLFPKNARQQFRRHLAPVFIVGNILSGSAILDALFENFDDIRVFRDRSIITGLRRRLAQENAGYPSSLQIVDSEKASQLRQHYFDLQNEMTTERGKKLVWNSYPLDLLEIPLILKIFPRAKFIFAYCHPADSVLNAYLSPFVLNDTSTTFASLEKTTEFCSNTLRLWEKYKKEIPFDFIEVKYEDVLQSPKKEITRILKFIDPDEKTGALKTLKQSKQWKVISESYQKSHPPMRWQRYGKHLKPHLAKLKPFIKAMGYGV